MSSAVCDAAFLTKSAPSLKDFSSDGKRTITYGSNKRPRRSLRSSIANSDPSFDYILNNQIWLYETSNIIEFHFGNNSVTDPVYDEFFIGLIDFDNSPYYAIDGSATSPVLVRVQNSGTFDGIPAYPTNGLVYTLTPKVSDIETILKPYTFSSDFNKFSINTSTDFIVNITDINGKAIDTNRFQSDANGTYFLSDIAAGIYLVNIQIGNNQFVEKIIVR